MPGYIDIGQRYEGNGEAEELKAFQTGGCLGTADLGERSAILTATLPSPYTPYTSISPHAGHPYTKFYLKSLGLPTFSHFGCSNGLNFPALCEGAVLYDLLVVV